MTQTARQQLLIEARRLARAGGCFISEKNGAFRVFRKTTQRAVYLGYRTNPADLRAFVRRLVAIH